MEYGIDGGAGAGAGGGGGRGGGVYVAGNLETARYHIGAEVP